jgi:uncharacterized GH25 family protein
MFKLSPLLFALALLTTTSAQSHNRWLLPSHFAVSSEQDAWVMIDITASNETFNVDKPMGADRLLISGPNGNRVPVGASFRGHRKSVVDVNLKDSGTYQLLLASEPRYWSSYQLPDSDKIHWLNNTNKSNRSPSLPHNAKNVKSYASSARVLSYVTLNQPTSNFTLTGKGLELTPLTHPSDIAENEPVKLQFMFEGQATKNVKISIIKDGVRYRNNPNALSLTTNENGIIDFQLSSAGRYLLIAEYEQENPNDPMAEIRNGELFFTFEAVLN